MVCTYATRREEEKEMILLKTVFAYVPPLLGGIFITSLALVAFLALEVKKDWEDDLDRIGLID